MNTSDNWSEHGNAGRGLRLALVAGVHVALFGALAAKAPTPLRALPERLLVWIEPARAPDPPPPAPVPKPPPAVPPQPALWPAPEVQVQAVAPPSPAPAPVVVPPPQPVPAPPSSTEPRQLTVVAPRPAPAPPAEPRRLPPTAVAYRVEPPVEVPRASRRARESGTVWLRVRVDASGLPVLVTLARSSGFARLDEQALWAMRQARFQPYSENGQPIEWEVIAPIEYVVD